MLGTSEPGNTKITQGCDHLLGDRIATQQDILRLQVTVENCVGNSPMATVVTERQPIAHVHKNLPRRYEKIDYGLHGERRGALTSEMGGA